jgi:hypothetical protein
MDMKPDFVLGEEKIWCSERKLLRRIFTRKRKDVNRALGKMA